MPDMGLAFGWATADLIHLDAMVPGLIGRLITAPSRRRQAIFSVLASRVAGPVGGTEESEDDAELATLLFHGRASRILAHVFGDVPLGWLSALARLDEVPLVSASAYQKLHAIFADPSNRIKADLLVRTHTISERTLTVLDTLDPRWRLTGVLDRVESYIGARELNRALAFTQRICSTATDGFIVQAIGRLPADQSLADLIARFLRRADRFPTHPVLEDRELRPLTCADDFVKAALKYRNCLRERIEDALRGQVAYAEFRGEAILEFRPLAAGFGWLLHDVHATRNAFVCGEVRSAAEAKCLTVGVPCIDRRDREPDLIHLCRFLRNPANTAEGRRPR